MPAYFFKEGNLQVAVQIACFFLQNRLTDTENAQLANNPLQFPLMAELVFGSMPLVNFLYF